MRHGSWFLSGAGLGAIALALAGLLLSAGAVLSEEIALEAASELEDRSAYHFDTSRLIERMGESCVYGAAAGATSAILTTGSPVTGLWALPPLLSLGVTAAGVGCVVASSGAAAAELYRQTWSTDGTQDTSLE